MRGFLSALLGICALFIQADMARADLLVNGDFSQGNVGFSSQYGYVVGNGTVFTQPGSYSVVANPGTAFPNGYVSFGDHTTGTGLMLFADGTAAGTYVWSESVSVSPGPYTFTAWIANPDPPADSNLATLALFVNGAEVGTPFAITQAGGIWQQWTTQLTFASASQAMFSIQDVDPNPLGAGNDYVIDDLSLTASTSQPAATTPEPGSFLLSATGIMAWAAMFRRRLLGRNDV